MEISPEVLSVIREVIELSVEETKKNRVEAFRVLNEEVQKDKIVFAGDSMIERFPTSEMLGRHTCVYNRGIDGIETTDLLAHLNEHILDLKPSKLFLLIGANDIGTGSQPEEIVERIQEICTKVSAQLKTTKIYIISVCPVNIEIQSKNNILGRIRSNGLVLKLNELIQNKVIASSNYTYINVHPLLAGDDGELKSGYTVDGLHLNVDGYKEMRKVVQPYI